MRQINYDDLYRFTVSIGIIFIVTGISLPYFFLTSDFGLNISEEEYGELVESYKNIVDLRGFYISGLIKLLPWLSVLLFLTGLGCVGYGIKQWNEKQKGRDTIDDLESKKAEYELKALSSDEEKQKAEDEVKEDEIEVALSTDSVSIDEIDKKVDLKVQSYLKVEKDIYSIFKRYDSTNYTTLINQLVDKKYEIDILMRTEKKGFADRIIEVKYSSDRIYLSTLLKSLRQLSIGTSYYKSKVKKSVVPVLIYVYTDDLNPIKLQRFEEEIEKYKLSDSNLNRLRYRLIKYSELNSLSVKSLLKKSDK